MEIKNYPYAHYFALMSTVLAVNGASIPWSPNDPNSSSSSSRVWYFQGRKDQSNQLTTFYASDKIPFSPKTCGEPKNLPEQFMDWFRESTSDPSILALTFARSIDEKSESMNRSLDTLITESEECSRTPSTDPNASTMERALCPWVWRLNRDENREPKLISEAKCLCHRSRGSIMVADCLPIQREFPVLRRVRCDERGKYQYVKSHQTITVGCHSVMSRVARAAQPPPWLARGKEV